MRIHVVALAIVALVSIAGARAQTSSAQAAPAGNAEAGKKLYESYGCYQCHDYEGQGGEALRIAPTAYPFDTFAERVRRPPNEMPAYALEVLSDADLEAIYRYVRSRAEPTVELPLL